MKDIGLLLTIVLLSIFFGIVTSNVPKPHENEERICIKYKTITRKRLFSIVPTYETYNECVDWEWQVKGEDKE